MPLMLTSAPGYSDVSRFSYDNGQVQEHNAKNVFDSSRRVFDVKNNLTCSRILRNRAVTDINTQVILHKIDKVYNSSWLSEPYVSADRLFGQQLDQAPVDLDKRTERLEVVFVPHSHSDPGWLKTLNEYFDDQTRPTLNFMVEKLMKYPNMTFVWAESVFLAQWWVDLDNEMKRNVRKLIERKQLEIVVGSWVVPDEATSHYFALIDQMIVGHQWLEENLGAKPQASWSLDPFGYSPTLAYLYHKAGYKHMVILRIHQYLKQYFQGNRQMEFYWRQHWDSTGHTDILTTLLPYRLYNFKHQCGPDQFECLHFDFRNIEGESTESMALPINEKNIADIAKRLLVQVTKKNNLYKHNVVLVPLGDDFRYDRDIEWDQQYFNYQKLINYMNSIKKWKVHARFGTLKDYYELINDKKSSSDQSSYPTLQGDFFPYNDVGDDYWTGYFTTRPYDKNFERELETSLRSAEFLNVMAKAVSKPGQPYLYYKSNIDKLDTARESLALFQHHDGITGTARAYVVIDYETKLQRGHLAVKEVLAKATGYLIAQHRNNTGFVSLTVNPFKSLHELDPGKRVIDLGSRRNSTLVLFNPSGQQREDVIRVTVNYEYLEVYNEKGNLVLSQINPIWKGDDQLEISSSMFELVFLANIPPLGLVKYTIMPVARSVRPKENLAAFLIFSSYRNPVILPDNTRFHRVAPRGETVILENSFLRARFSARSGYLQSITTKTRLATKKVQIELLMYKSRNSGAYIFSPTGPAVDTEMFNKPPIMVIKGPIVSEIRVYQRESVCEHIVRVYNSTGMLGTVLDINNFANMTLKQDKELIMRLTTDVKNVNTSFYTDLNGLHSIKRKRFKNFPSQANYYPMTSFAYMEDEETRLSILSAQSLGVSSQEDSSLEVMLHRKPLYDDGRGLGEGIFMTKRSPSQFFLLMEKPNRDRSDNVWNKYYKNINDDNRLESFPSLHAHLLLDYLQHHTVVMEDSSNRNGLLRPVFEPLRGSLPCDIRLVNLRGMRRSSPVTGVNSQSPSAALILHKIGFDCSLPLMGFYCDQKSHRDIIPSQLFRDVQLKLMKETSLSLMYEYSTVDLNSPLALNPMDLQTYKVSFKN